MKNMKKLLISVFVGVLVVSSSIHTQAFVQPKRFDQQSGQGNVTEKTKEQEVKTAKEAGVELYDDSKVEENTEQNINTDNTAMPDTAQPTEKMQITKSDAEITADLQTKETTAPDIYNDEDSIDPEQKVRVIIVMDGNAILDDDSYAEQNLFTSIRSTSMETGQRIRTREIEETVLNGEKLDIRYQYTWLTNAIATEVSYGKMDEIEKMDGIKSVILQPMYTIDPQTSNDGEMIGREETWNTGYTGEGIKIAVIDTGLDISHPSFEKDPVMTDDNETAETLSPLLPGTHAAKIYEKNYGKDLLTENVWYSNKIPYGFNYVDENLSVDHNGDNAGDHGTHVAGIAAANAMENTDVVGVAKDAQVYVLKVFGNNGGAYADDLLAAVEDSLILDADVINMSVGSPAGFITESDEVDAIYQRVAQTDTILAIAAGNSNNSASGNLWGTDTSLTSNPDNGIMSSPATYASSTTVASVDNQAVFSYYFKLGEERFAYSEGTNNTGQSFLDQAGNTLDYVMIDNLGQSVEDFKNANVEGKVAVVQRGVNSFGQKRKNAQEAGAKAIIIYNNTSGTIGMDVGDEEANIPIAAVTMQAGESMAKAAEAGNARIFVSSDLTSIKNDTAYRMSEFSSWGVSPNLELKPDITAPGGDIYSTINNGNYGTMSGTSMASPNLAGCAAVVKQYVRETYPDMSDEEIHKYINALLMNTAVPLMYDETLPFSPRSQGAGLVNAYYAVTTPAYIDVKGSALPKVSLKDDPKKTGVYTYEFEITNQSDKELRYRIDTNVQSEGVIHDDASGKDFMSMTPVALDANTSIEAENASVYDFNQDGVVNTTDARWLYQEIKKGNKFDVDHSFVYDINGDERIDENDVQAMLNNFVGIEDKNVNLKKEMIRIAPHDTKTVKVTIRLADSAKAYMDNNFANGIYVEGFTTLTPMHAEGIALSVPYMGFYGDWTQAPIFDDGFYWEKEEESDASQAMNVLFAIYGGNVAYPGVNPYFDEAFDEKHISISPNNDSKYDKIEAAMLSLMRNARKLSFTYEDAKTKEIIDHDVQEYARKSFLVPELSRIMPFVYPPTEEGYIYDFTDKNGDYLENNRQLNLHIKGTLDFEDDTTDSANDTWTIPITIDTQAPEVINDVTDLYVDPATGKQYITLTFKDNVDVAAMNFLNLKGTTLLAQYPIDAAEANEEIKMTFDVTGLGSDFLMVLGDYAGNESSYRIHTENNDPIIDTSLLYGYRVNDKEILNDSAYGWIAMDKENKEKTKVLSSEPYMNYGINAAEYVGGYILAVDNNDTLVWIKPGFWDDRKEIAKINRMITEMAFDPASKTLYAYDFNNMQLITIDYLTGEVEEISDPYMFYGLVAMSVGNDGVLYGINQNGLLQTIDKTSGTWGETLYNTNKTAQLDQSMTFVPETNDIYWAYYGDSEDAGKLYRIDLDQNYAMTDLGYIAGQAEVVGLMYMNDRGFRIPKEQANSIALSSDKVSMLIGDTRMLEVIATPWYGEMGVITWSSEDESIAKVDELGNITAIKQGETNIVAKTDDGKLKATCRIHVVKPSSNLRGFAISNSDISNKWISFDMDALDDVSVDSEVSPTTFNAGEYVDGYIYAYSASSAFYRIDAETLEAEQLSDNRDDVNVLDMTFDYSSGFMYALTQDMYGTSLVKVDMMNGDFENAGSATDRFFSPACAIACDKDGNLYMMMQNGILYTYNVDDMTLEEIGASGFSGSPMFQSMAFDHETNELYWAMLSMDGYAMMMYVDTNNGEAHPVGGINGGIQLTALYAPSNNLPKVPYQAVESVALKTPNMHVLAGSKTGIGLEIKPLNATVKDVEWTVDQPKIAEIKDNIVYAKTAGNAVAKGILTDNKGVHEVSLNIQVAASAGDIHGFVLNDLSMGSGQFWSKVKDNNLNDGMLIETAVDSEVYAGEYYNGKVYTYGIDKITNKTAFMVFDGETLKRTQVIPSAYTDVLDMTFDYSQGAMYGIGTPFNTTSNSTLYGIDITNGKLYPIAQMDQEIRTIAASTDGVLYGVSSTGVLYTIDKVSGALHEVGSTGLTVNQYQSMAFDHTTGNLYWSYMFYDNMSGGRKSGLKLVDPKTANVTHLGLIGEKGCVFTSMFMKPNPSLVPQDSAVTGISMDQTKILINQGDQKKLDAIALPINVHGAKPIQYTSSDPKVASVDVNGNITGLAYGKATITATSGAFKKECVVTVIDPANEFYVMNTNGWQTSPILNPGSSNRVEFENKLFEMQGSVYKDNYFFALASNSHLWKFNEDRSEMNDLGNMKDWIPYDSAIYKNVRIDRITRNAFNNKIYLLTYLQKGEAEGDYAVYEIDESTKSASLYYFNENNFMNRAGAFSFVDKDQFVFYDLYDFTLRSVDVENKTEKDLGWMQNSMDSSDNSAMYYSKELDTLFYAASGYENSRVKLYSVDPVTAVVQEIGQTDFDTDIRALLLKE